MRTVTFRLSLIVIFLIPSATFVVLPGVGTASRAFGILAGVFWLLTVLETGKIRKIGAFHVFFFLFFVLNMCSILWTKDPARTLTQIFTYVQLAVFSLMLWDLYTTRAAIRAALQAYVLGLTVPIASTVANFIAHTGTEYALYGRYASSGSGVNTTGILLALGLPLAWYLTASAGEGKIAFLQKLVNYAYIPAITFAMILTATRFALIMSLPAFLFGLGILTRLKPISLILAFVFLVVSLFMLGSRVPKASLQRLGTIGSEIQAGDFNDRRELWSVGLDLWTENPIFGIGSAGYDTAVISIYGRPRSAHNSFVATAVELGIVGSGLLGIILFMAVLQAWSHRTRLDTWFWLTLLICWLLGNCALTWIHTKPTWLIFSLLAASASLCRQPDKSSSGLGVIEQK